MSDWYDVSGNPGTKAQGSSAQIRAEFALIQAAFGKMPALTGAGLQMLFVNTGGTALESVTASTARSRLGLVIGTNVQAFSSVLENTTASFTTELANKLGFITVTQAVDLNALVTNTVFGQGHSTTSGAHKAVMMDTVADPTPASGQGALSVKLFEGRPELYWTGYGLSPLRMTYNGALNAEFSSIAATFASVKSNSSLRAKAVDLVITSNATTLDMSLAQTFRLTVTVNVEITITNMPTGGDTTQAVYLELINGGDYAVTFACADTIQWVGSAAPTLTTGGKDGIVIISHDETAVTLAPLLDIGAA